MWNQRYGKPGFAYGAEPNDFLAENAQHLRPGGEILCLAEGLEYGTGGPREADLLMTVDSAREELAGLDVVSAEEKLREVHEGRYHSGLSAVLQVVARKP